MNPVANLVGQTSISTGAGDMSLNVTQGRQSFSAAFAANDVDNQFFYFISNPIANEWEVGSGYLVAGALHRATVLDSSNAGSLVSFTSGSKSVVSDVPAAYQTLLVQPAYRLVTAAGAVTVIATDKTVEINKTIAAPTVANVDPSALPVGKFITVKDGKGDADINNITITPASGTFDGQGTYVLRYPYQAITFYSNGTNLRGVA